MEVNNNFLTNYPKWAQFCCLCNVKLDYKDNLWETIVNLHDFYSLNLWRILSSGLGWSTHTVTLTTVLVNLHFYVHHLISNMVLFCLSFCYLGSSISWVWYRHEVGSSWPNRSKYHDSSDSHSGGWTDNVGFTGRLQKRFSGTHLWCGLIWPVSSWLVQYEWTPTSDTTNTT